jgi:hypothetical protein
MRECDYHQQAKCEMYANALTRFEGVTADLRQHLALSPYERALEINASQLGAEREIRYGELEALVSAVPDERCDICIVEPSEYLIGNDPVRDGFAPFGD